MNEPFWCLGHLDDQQLLQNLRNALAQGRKLTALLIAHLSEVETRRLHLHASSPSLFDYCVKRLGLSEDEACRRIDVARLARRCPEIYPLLADGSLSISVVALLKPHLDEPSSSELLQASRGLSVVKVRELLASRFPRPDVPSSIRRLPEKREPRVPRAESVTLALVAPVASAPIAGPAPAAPAGAPQAAAPSATPTSPSTAALSAAAPRAPSTAPPRPATRAVEPLAADRFRVQLTAGSELKRKLEQCRELCAAHNRLAAELEFGARHVERAISDRRNADPRHRG